MRCRPRWGISKAPRNVARPALYLRHDPAMERRAAVYRQGWDRNSTLRRSRRRRGCRRSTCWPRPRPRSVAISTGCVRVVKLNGYINATCRTFHDATPAVNGASDLMIESVRRCRPPRPNRSWRCSDAVQRGDRSRGHLRGRLTNKRISAHHPISGVSMFDLSAFLPYLLNRAGLAHRRHAFSDIAEGRA